MYKLSASEALFGFAAWLTSREKPVTLSAHHDAGIAAALAAEFCEINHLEEPRENWTDFLIMPGGQPDIDKSNICPKRSDGGPHEYLEKVRPDVPGVCIYCGQ